MTNSLQLRIAALGLVLGPLCFTLGDTLRRVVDSSTSSSAVELAAKVADRPGVWLAAGLLSALAPLFFLPGIHALVATTRGRGSRVVGVGGALMSLGLVAAVGHAVAFYALAALYGRAGRAGRAGSDAATIKALDKASESYPLLVALIVAFIVGMTIGVIALLVGLRRAGRIPVWAVVAGVVFAVARSSGGLSMGALGMVAALVAFVPAARSLLGVPARSDAGDDRPQQVALA
jgi:hypothetical protein